MPPDALRPVPSTESVGRRIAANRERQRALYGAPFAERVPHLVETLGISQAQLARTLGMSPSMLSQLVSGRQMKIGDPVALARFQMLDHRCAAFTEPAPRAVAERLLAEVGRARWRWARSETAGRAVASAVQAGRPAEAPRPAPCPVDALRRVASPSRLAAAAAVLGPGFPELAEVLRRAAARR
jgi:hypothetical protein